MTIYSVAMKNYTMRARETIYNFKTTAEREEFIKTLSKEDQEAADQVNRGTEFQVLGTTYEY